MRRNRTLDRGPSSALVAAGTLALALVLACGGEETPAASDSGSPAAQIEIPAVAEPEEIPLAFDEAVLPDEYPDDLPTFPGATPTTAMMAPGGSGMVTLSAASPVEEVVAFYAKALPEQGWSVDDSKDGGKRLQISKGDRSATVTIDPAKDGAEISVLLGGA